MIKKKENKEKNKQNKQHQHDKKDKWSQSDNKKGDNNSGRMQSSMHIEQENRKARQTTIRTRSAIFISVHIYLNIETFVYLILHDSLWSSASAYNFFLLWILILQ